MRSVAMLLLALGFAAPAHAREVTIDIQGCRDVYQLLAAMKGGAPRDSAARSIDRLLETPAFRVVFRHYNRSWRPNHLPPDVFKRMILSLAYSGEYQAGENERADRMLVRWRAAYADLPRYRRQLEQLEKANLQKLVDRGVQYAQGWLPRTWLIPDFTLVVAPQGGSPAFSIDEAQGYDFFQLPQKANGDLDLEDLVGTIAHESNHLGMHGGELSLANASDSLALRVISMVVAEGVATKFISGPPPGCAPEVPGVPFHIFTKDLAAAWNARLPEEPDMVRHMSEQLDRAVHGTLTQDELDRDMREYWFDGAIGRAYVLGSELFGAIAVGLGKDSVLVAIEDPRRLFQLYNEALERKPALFPNCVRMPEGTVAQALAIGRTKPGATKR